MSYVEAAAAERMERRRRLAIQQYFRGGSEQSNAAETLRLDLCHGCALEAAGISDDGSSVAANYLQRRRVAFNAPYPGIQDYHLLPWHPGFNELGLTTCSACGPNGRLSTNQRLKQRTEPVPQAKLEVMQERRWSLRVTSEGVASASPDRRWRPIRLALSKKKNS